MMYGLVIKMDLGVFVLEVFMIFFLFNGFFNWFKKMVFKIIIINFVCFYDVVLIKNF